MSEGKQQQKQQQDCPDCVIEALIEAREFIRRVEFWEGVSEEERDELLEELDTALVA